MTPYYDLTAGLQPTGAYITCSATPWRDYANAILAAKEKADKQSMAYSMWPPAVIRVHKWRDQQFSSLATDVGGPDLTLLPDWPALLNALRADTKRGSSSSRSSCESLFLAKGWTLRDDDSDGRTIVPPRPLFGSNLQVTAAPSMNASNLLGIRHMSRLMPGDVIVGLDGVLITRGASQVAALVEASPSPCEHVFVVRRKDAVRSEGAEAMLDALARQDETAEPDVGDDARAPDFAVADKYDMRRTCEAGQNLCALQ